MNSNNILYSYLMRELTIENIIKFIAIYFFIIWIFSIVWVYKDISNRTENIYYQIFSILILLLFTPLFWIFIYLIIRPTTTLFEKYYQEVENNLVSLSKEVEDKIKKCSNKKS